MDVTGRVEAGVEHGSVVLVVDPGGPGATTYQLGAAGAALVGRRARLVGRTRPDLLTTAQQGTPVSIDSLVATDDDPGAIGSCP